LHAVVLVSLLYIPDLSTILPPEPLCEPECHSADLELRISWEEHGVSSKSLVDIVTSRLHGSTGSTGKLGVRCRRQSLRVCRRRPHPRNFNYHSHCDSAQAEHAVTNKHNPLSQTAPNYNVGVCCLLQIPNIRVFHSLCVNNQPYFKLSLLEDVASSSCAQAVRIGTLHGRNRLLLFKYHSCTFQPLRPYFPRYPPRKKTGTLAFGRVLCEQPCTSSLAVWWF
jgi:hypothetical protein